MSNSAASHPDPERLRWFGLGQLPAEEAQFVESHVAACDQCTSALQKVQDDSLINLLSQREGVGDTATAPGGVPPLHDANPDSAGSDPAPLPLRGHPRYRVLRLLGRGGMGEVYLANHQHLGRLVALKVIKPGLLGDPAVLQRFQREMRAVAQLAHPNIVQAHDADQAGELHFLVMEYVPGQSLHDCLEDRGPLSVAEACDFVRQAALALQHAFAHGLTHGDVKPHNLMWTPTGQIKVLDFGLARIVGEPHSEFGVVMGTADYLAPEQAQHAAPDIRSDVYSLGCTLYHLLTGSPPYSGGSNTDKIRRHTSAEPASLAALRPDAPAALEAVVARMLARNPADRYQTPAETAAALAPFSRPGSDESSTTAVTSRRRDSRRRSRLLIVLALLLVAAVAVVAVLSKWNRDRPSPLFGGPEASLAPAEPAAPRPLAVVRRLPWAGRKDFGTEFSNDSRLCAAFGHDAIRVWDVETGNVVQEIGGQSWLDSVCFLPDDKELLSSHKDGMFRRWDLATGKQVSEFHGTRGGGWVMGVSPAGDCFSSRNDQGVFVWDVATGKERFHVTAVGRKATLLNSAPLSPDGRRLLTVDRLGAGGGLARLFDARTGKELLSIPIKETPEIHAWSPDGRRIYLNASDPTQDRSLIVCFDAETGQRISQTRMKPGLHSTQGRRFNRDIRWFGALNPDDRLLHVYDVREGKRVGTAHASFLPWSLSIAPNGRYAACAVRGAVVVYRLDSAPLTREGTGTVE